MLVGCAAAPSVVTKTDVARPRIHDHVAPRAVDSSRPVTIDADKMERFGAELLVIFSGNVIARHDSSVQYADRMEAYLDEKGDRIRRIVFDRDRAYRDASWGPGEGSASGILRSAATRGAEG
jgi:hypothetical protein